MGFSPSFGKDSDDEVATEQLTAVVDARVDVTFMPHDVVEIRILIVRTVTRFINQRQRDQAQVTVGPWVSQTLARPIL